MNSWEWDSKIIERLKLKAEHGSVEITFFVGDLFDTHHLTPDETRSVADALIEAARQIDGKTSGVVDLVRQLEAARAEIEKLKGLIERKSDTPSTHTAPAFFDGFRDFMKER